MSYKVDYSIKSEGMNFETDEINNLISFMNYCFLTKNNFLVPSFNEGCIHWVYVIYNKMKTNILTPQVKDLFQDADPRSIKLLRYILHNTDMSKLPDDISGDLLIQVLRKMNPTTPKQ